VLDAESLIPSGEEELWIENLVRSHIIENWESQDEPEHLRTIRDRILSNEQRAGYLLELYQQIWDSGEVAANNSEEEARLQLSGIVVKQGGKLRVYNRIYREVFDRSWIDRAFGNLRPYSEAFRGWKDSDYQDDWLLRGAVLQEAQAWAKGKTLSYLDQQFLAACEKKEIEERIAVADKEAELERERKDREAAQQINKALAEANQKAKKRIQVGAAVLIVAVLGAVVSGVLAGNTVIEANSKVEDATSKVAEANQRATEAQKREHNAQANEQKVQARVTEAEAREKYLKQKATAAREKQASAQQQAQQAEAKFQQAQQALGKAQESAKAAESRVQELNQQRQKTDKELNRARNELQSAQKQQQEAQANLKKAKRGQKQVEEQLAQAETARQKVEDDINNVSQLSQLAAQLQKQGRSSEANEAWNQAGRITNMKDHPLKQAMLFASISLTYQELKQQNEAEQALNKSVENLKQLPSQVALDNPENWSTHVYVMRAKGKFLKEHKNTEAALKAYEEAFNTLKEVKKNMHKREFLPKVYPIISANIIEKFYREYISLLSKIGQDNSGVREALKEHLLAELEFLMESGNWKEADDKTKQFMLDQTGKEEKDSLNAKQLRTFPCDDLRTLDNLWVKYSKGRFGFSVQKRIWLSRDVNADLGRFVDRIGWGQLTNNGASFVYWYMHGVPFDLSSPEGRLPWAPTYYGGDHETRKNYMSRLIECLRDP
jgi:myosin heavy subunit